ncbi:hypothetical protein NMG60_11024518 [Bertholletia excelsa]
MSEVADHGAATLPLSHPAVSAPAMQMQYNSPSLSSAPLLSIELSQASAGSNNNNSKPPPKSSRTTPNSISPLDSPTRRAIQLTKQESTRDEWLPITESRNGNAFYAAFHTVCSGVGIQALVLPVALTVLGWTWGIICLVVAFIWQLYTMRLLVKLHESTESGMRYSRYVHLFTAAFGGKMANAFAAFPIMYLSGGTCVALIVLGGGTMKTFFQIVCGEGCTAKPLTTVEWYLVYTSAAVLLSLLPNLNSIAGVSLVGAVTAVGYCTIMWLVSVTEGRLHGVSYDHVRPSDDVVWFFKVLNALGIIAFAFRGHNLTLEIQATMPSSEKYPSHVPMWRGVQAAYLIIALCLFPLAIGGYWAYGNKIPETGGMLAAIYTYHGRDAPQYILGLISLFIIINSVTSYQIYAMQMFDDMEAKVTCRLNRPLPWWARVVSRFMFGYGCFFVAVAIPFLGSLAGLIGGIALPVTFAYPCFMWIKMKKPKKHGLVWWVNWVLGVSGTVLTVLLIAAGIYVVINTGIKVSFFKPQ